MSNLPFTPDDTLTAIAIAFTQPGMIADLVLPRIPVSREEFKYLKFDPEEMFTIPDTRVGRKSAPNQVEFNATEITDSTVDFGLDDVIPQKDIDEAPANFDPKGWAVEGLTQLVMLDREVRAANLVFNANTFPAGNKATLVGASQFSDVTSDPIGAVGDAMDVPLARPNTLVFGQTTWTKFRRHPKIVKAANANDGDAGMAARRAVAEIFEVDEVIVGRSWVNNAKKGQAPIRARAWGNHLALLHIDRTAARNRSYTFGFTADRGRVAGSIANPNAGLKGGETVRSGEQVKEVISAADAGYFFEDAVA